MHWLTFTFKDFFSVSTTFFCCVSAFVVVQIASIGVWHCDFLVQKKGRESQVKKVLFFLLVVLLVKKMSYFCLQEMHGLRLGLSNFFAAIISSQQCWKKCMRQKKLKTLQRAVLLNMLASNPNGHSIFRSSYRHDSYGKRRKHSKSKVSKKHVSNRICHFLFTYIFHKIWDKPQCLKIILKMWHL